MVSSFELFDTHIHFDDEAFEHDRELLWSEAQSAGVTQALTVGVAPNTWPRTIQIAHALPNVYVALGIHPRVVQSLQDHELSRVLSSLPEALKQAQAVAIGEIGLDKPAGNLERQQHIFCEQLAIAKSLQLPVSIHIVQAHGLALKILQKMQPFRAGGVIHSYSGSHELVKDYIRLGFSISFACSITRSNARKIIEAAQAVPLERILIETDAPFQTIATDVRTRTRGVPVDLVTIAHTLATVRSQPVENVAIATTTNAQTLFKRNVESKTKPV